MTPGGIPAEVPVSAWSPLRTAVYRNLWLAAELHAETGDAGHDLRIGMGGEHLIDALLQLLQRLTDRVELPHQPLKVQAHGLLDGRWLVHLLATENAVPLVRLRGDAALTASGAQQRREFGGR